MESTQKTNKKRTKDQDLSEENSNIAMSTTTNDEQPVRKIKKAKRRADPDQPIIDEDGNELSFEDDSDEFEMNQNAKCIDEGEVIQADSDSWGDDDDEEMQIDSSEKKAKKEKKQKKKKADKVADDDDMDEEADTVGELPEDEPTITDGDMKGENQIWNDQAEPLKDDEQMDFDSSAYQMLHRSNVEWPCLSIDIIVRERASGPTGIFNQNSWFPSEMHGALNQNDSVFDKRLDTRVHKKDQYPMTTYFCGGSQGEDKNTNKIYVMKWSQMEKTLYDDVVPDDNSEDDHEDILEKMNNIPKEPVIKFESIPHKGCVNRLRSLHGSSIVATWNDEGEVGIYNVQSAIDQLDSETQAKEETPQVSYEGMSAGQKKKMKKKANAAKKVNYGGTKVAQFRHKQEGYAIEWSPSTFGRLASGSCDAHLWIYAPADENCSSFVKESQVALQGHKDSIEDIQWSPSQEHVLATCSVDQTIKLWDLRATQMKSQMSFKAHDCDVNVMSWNTHTKFLLASGDDKGEFRIWDLRMMGNAAGSSNNKELDSITRIRWHTKAITSLQFEPREESVLAVCSEDNKLTMWDFSVEVDDQEQQQINAGGMEIPPQLMFLHQGQKNMKELRFHPQFRTLLLTTSEDSFNIFRPNLDPDYNEDDCKQEEEEEKQSSNPEKVKGADFDVDMDEDEEAEEKRVIRTARQLNKQRNARSKSRGKNLKRRKE